MESSVILYELSVNLALDESLPENDYERACERVREALTEAGFTTVGQFGLAPVCICDGGDQGDGLCAIPHEPHCPRFESW